MLYPREIIDKIACYLPFQVALEISEWSAKEICRTTINRDRVNERQMRHWWESAAKRGHIRFLNWLNTQKVPGYSRSCMDVAIRHNRLDSIKCLRKQGKFTFGAEALKEAIMDGHLETVKYFHIYQWRGWTKIAMHYATENGHEEMINYLTDPRKEDRAGPSIFDSPKKKRRDMHLMCSTMQRPPSIR